MTSLELPTLARKRARTARSEVAAISTYIPSRQAALAPPVSGTDCTGVSYRVKAEAGISTASLAATAARGALQAAGAEPATVDLVVVATTSPDVLWPSTACLLQTELGLKQVPAFDLYSAEAGLLTALIVADRYVGRSARLALVVGAESDNQLVNLPTQPFLRRGRAACATVLRSAGSGSALLGAVIGAAAQGPAEADADLHDEACVRGLSEAVGECLQLAGTDLDSVDLVICDQTAPEIMRVWSRLNQVPAAKLLLDPQRYQQVFSTAPLFVLSDAVQEGRLRSGQLALLLSCGRGPAWAVAIVRWQGGGLVAC